MTLIKIQVPGKGLVRLTQQDYIATGGEGSVYGKGGFVYKLFLDPAAARARGIEEKLALLKKVQHPYIVAPIDVVHSERHEVIGFYMPVADGLPLVKSFTNAWREPNGFDMQKSLALVENMRLAVKAAHHAGALLVDANEANWHFAGTEPRLIDVDSWQVGRFKASVIMPSIRDPHAASFSHETDWYSWAVVSFQVLTGTHPYKGSHPDFKRGDMVARMKANASVFDPKVSLNAGVRDFTAIPAHLLSWYRAVFQDGLRSEPPNAVGVAASPKRRKSTDTPASTSVSHTQALALDGEILAVANALAFFRSASGPGVYDLLRKQHVSGVDSADVERIREGQAALLRYSEGLLLVTLEAGGLSGRFVATERDPRPRVTMTRTLAVLGERLVVFGNRLFVLCSSSEKGLAEISTNVLGGAPVLSVKASWPFLAKASQIFPTMAIFDALGTPYLVVPAADAVVVDKAIPLRGYRVLDAQMLCEVRVLVLAMSRSDGQTYWLELHRVPGAGFEVVTTEPTDDLSLNTAVNEQGIAIQALDGNVLRVLSARTGASKRVSGSGVDASLRLFSLPSGIHYYVDNRVVRLALS